GAPDVTELHRDYIAASEQAEAARVSTERKRAEILQKAYIRARRAFVVASVAGLAAAAAGLVAYASKNEAQRAEEKASRERDAALLVQSRHLSDIAVRQLEAGDASSAMLLSLAGLPDYGPRSGAARSVATRPYLAEIEERLYQSLFDNREQMLFAGHQGTVLGAAVSSNGRRIATASADGTIRLWDAKTGQETRLLKSDAFGSADAQVSSVSFMLGESQLLAASGDKAYVLDAASGKALLEMSGHTDAINSLAISGDERFVVTAAEDMTAVVWDARSGKKVASLSGHSG